MAFAVLKKGWMYSRLEIATMYFYYTYRKYCKLFLLKNKEGEGRETNDLFKMKIK